jgi:small subunit ribosomal protein S17
MKNSKTTTENQKTSRPRILSGVVVSDKMKDTVVVSITRFEKHPKYQKFQKISKKYKAHDPGNSKKIGEKIKIEECRPISKDKHFKVVVSS